MKYATINKNGATEIRFDSLNELPIGAVELTDEQYFLLLNGTHILSNGIVVINPNPPVFI